MDKHAAPLQNNGKSTQFPFDGAMGAHWRKVIGETSSWLVPSGLRAL
jgi:hypothetical protein